MKKRKALWSRAFAWILVLTMMASLTPVNALASEKAMCICAGKCTANAVNDECSVCSADGVETEEVCLGKSEEDPVISKDPVDEGTEPKEDAGSEENQEEIPQEILQHLWWNSNRDNRWTECCDAS